MKNEIVGVLIICALLITGVYAFGPHTRINYTDVMEECVYYYGPGNSCEVAVDYCDPTGANKHIVLDTDTQCINLQVEEVVAEPMVVEEEPVAEPISAEPASTDGLLSYLWVAIPLLALFALLVILLLVYVSKYATTKEKLAKVSKKKNMLSRALDVCLHKKTRATCPRDGTPMKRTGELKQGPRGGMRQTYVCPKCSYRSMKTVKK